MISSIKERMQADLQFLLTNNFYNISISKIQELIKNKLEYKKNLTNEEERNLYASFKGKLQELQQYKLPFRCIEAIKHYQKANKTISLDRAIPFNLKQSLVDGKVIPSEMISTPIASKEQKKEILHLLLQRCLTLSAPLEGSLRVIEPIEWGHGTNSAHLAVNKRLVSKGTGNLLDEGFAPMCGELTVGGMNFPLGVNQDWISVETVGNLKRCWEYAIEISHSFKPSQFADAERFFIEKLDSLRNLSFENYIWDIDLIKLFQFKQWDPATFEKLKNRYSEKIAQLLQQSYLIPQTSLEFLILEALSCPIETLKKAIHNPRDTTLNLSPFLLSFIREKYESDVSYPIDKLVRAKYDRYHFYEVGHGKNILSSVITLRLSDQSFETLLQIHCDYENEYAQKEINIFLEVHSLPTIELLLLHFVQKSIQNKIASLKTPFSRRVLRLHNLFTIPAQEIFSEQEKKWITSPFPILLASTKTKCYPFKNEYKIPFAKWGEDIDLIFVKEVDLITITTWLKNQNLDKAMQVIPIEKLLPVFSLPFLIHAPKSLVAEASVFRNRDWENIDKQIQALSSHSDCAKARAIRVLIFSAIITEMYFSQGRLVQDPAQIPIKGFASNQNTIQKSNREIPSLEERIIQDANLLETTMNKSILKSSLWVYKDKTPQSIINLLISESKLLIELTEKPIIQDFLQNSKHPLQALVQIIVFSKIPFFNAYLATCINTFCSPENYMLTPEVEKDLLVSISEKQRIILSKL